MSLYKPQNYSNKPSPWGLTYLVVGRALAKTFPPGIFVASPLQEALVYSGHRFCPERHCPVGDTEQAFRCCLTTMNRECKSKGSIPYVATEYIPNDPRRPARKLMDAWILAHQKPVRTVKGEGFLVHFLEVPYPGESPPKATSSSAPDGAVDKLPWKAAGEVIGREK